MGTLGTRARNGKKRVAARRVEHKKEPHPALAKLAVALRERDQALRQQAATAEILRVISSSPADLRPVFEAILKSAIELCDAHLGLLNLCDGERLRTVAHRGGSREFARWIYERGAFKPDGSAILHALNKREASQIADAKLGPGYIDRKPNVTKFVDLGGVRTFLAVPIVKEGEVLGNLGIYRPEVRPFTDQQVALVSMFANQAAIAIENARLFNETKEALEQQTATAEILRVISSSPSDMQPVFDSILEHAMRLCDAGLGTVGLYDGKTYQHRAQRGGSAEYVKRLLDEPFAPGPDGTLGRMIAEGRPVHVPDYRELPAYRKREPRAVATVELGGARTYLAVPMVKEGRVVGGITIRRTVVRPFTRKQIDLLSTFASQAVIAIENVRLFNETKEALERQTATAEILKVIASSPSDVQPVFDAIAASARQLLGGLTGTVTRVVGDMQHLAAFVPKSESGDESLRGLFPARVGDLNSGRAIATLAPAFRTDTETDPTMSEAARENARTRGYRSVLAVPMVREGVAIGSISVARAIPGAFSDHQIGLLQTFADQAVIAIENVRLFNETKESLEQQTATADILKVISQSPTETQPVFDAIVQSAARLFAPSNVVIVMREGNVLQRKARSGSSQIDQAKLNSVWPLPLDPERSMAARSMLERSVIEIPDTEAAGLPAVVKRLGAAAGHRAITLVPLIREGEGIGVIGFTRPEPGFKLTEKQLALVRTFADQAVIAIENVRLFNETKEALEQQIATAKILGVMSSSPTDVQPVLDAVAETAARLCETDDAIIRRVDPDGLRRVAHFGPLPATPETEVHPLVAGSVGGRAVLERRAIHVEDIEEEVRQGRYAEAAALAAAAGWYRSMLAMPLVREGTAIGVIMIRRKEYRPFTEKQIALLKTFADQAVIAIENVRLFNETKESLERQTATAEILRVIASSPSDVQPVFDAIAASARRLLAGGAALVARRAGDKLELVAYTSSGETADAELRKQFPAPITGRGHLGKAILSAAPVGISDVQTDESYSEAFRASARTRGVRSIVSVPMLRDGEPIGVISVNRPVPGKFSEHQTTLLKTFANQAVIAIENVRLFKELQARTEALTKSVGQLTALGEVGQAISSTLDLETVLKTIVAHAVQLTGLDAGAIYEYDEGREEFHLRAAENMSEEIVGLLRKTPIRKGEGAVGSTALAREPVQIPEIRDESYKSQFREVLIRTGRRALLAVPLTREDRIVGALAVQRNTPGPFAPEVVELLKTFATQSALAIQNARLFREIAEKGRQLEVASQHKSQFLASMSHELRTPLNALLGFNEMLLGDIYGEVPGDMRPPLAQMQSSGKHLLRLINNVLDLAKIEAGRMELALAEYSVHDTVESVRSTLQPLAVEKGLDFLAAVPSEIPLAYGDPGRITQCLMNLAGNSLKFTKSGKVEISVAVNDGRLRYRVADTGIGIPPDKIEGLFTEFKQTDATVASEYGGTGLGLSISKKFVEMHGGRIWAESEPGRGSVFTFEVPLRAKAV